MNTPAYYVLAQYRMRHPAIGTFATVEEAEAHRATLPFAGKGWHVMGVTDEFAERDALPVTVGRCGCRCGCHRFEEDAGWPGSCAACCEPGDDCACGRALMQDVDMAPRSGRLLPPRGG